jgi:hypothetical protein
LAALAIGALVFALGGEAAQAQMDKDHLDKDQATKPTAAPGGQPQGEVGAVVVRPPRQTPHYDTFVPPDRAKAFAAEAAKDEAWRNYRNSIPALGAGPLERAKDYPGLQSYIEP